MTDTVNLIDEVLADWPVEWSRDNLNILVCARGGAARQMDSAPAVAVWLRYKYTRLAAVLPPLHSWHDAAAVDRLGDPNACVSGARSADVEAIVADIRSRVGAMVPVEVNCPDRLK